MSSVFNVFGDPTPGPRHFYGFHTCGFPWKGTVDSQQEVSSADAYRMSMKLSREGIIAGPSSGEALHGLLDYIAEAKSNGKLQGLADAATGETSCVFTCSDLPYQYLDGYFQKLAKDDFSPIENEVRTLSMEVPSSFRGRQLTKVLLAFQILLSCDQDRHDERWILDPQRAADMLNTRYPSSSGKEDEAYGTQISERSVQNRVAKSKSGNKGGFIGWVKTCFMGIEPPGEASSLEGFVQQSLVVLDLRSARDFLRRHIKGAHQMSLDTLCPGAAAGVDLFGDADAVYKVWTNLQILLGEPRTADVLGNVKRHGTPVLVLCYNGEVSRLATSLLRANGVEALSVRGGTDELWKVLDDE
ncbi:cysteine synthase K/M:Cysteine synthase B [Colletotrichum tofieldiae]|nr:cysteine synthase K/M:Cysteine synthase B [Colletotrichum tofieldiae]GKT95874.1 cysteine synthase K/M:cysteine synthase B [Colletotrichum tofieldiae]